MAINQASQERSEASLALTAIVLSGNIYIERNKRYENYKILGCTPARPLNLNNVRQFTTSKINVSTKS